MKFIKTNMIWMVVIVVSSVWMQQAYATFAIKNTLDHDVFIRTSDADIMKQHDYKSDWRELASQEVYKTNDPVTYLTISESRYPRYAEVVQNFKFPARDKIYLAIKQDAGKLNLVPDAAIDGSPVVRNIAVTDLQYIPDISAAFKSPLLAAIATEHRGSVDSIIHAQKSSGALFKLLNTEIAYGWTPLHLAVLTGYVRSGSIADQSIVGDLIKAGACLDSKTRSGLRPDDLLKDKLIVDEKHKAFRNVQYITNIFDQFIDERKERVGTELESQCGNGER